MRILHVKFQAPFYLNFPLVEKVRLNGYFSVFKTFNFNIKCPYEIRDRYNKIMLFRWRCLLRKVSLFDDHLVLKYTIEECCLCIIGQDSCLQNLTEL